MILKTQNPARLSGVGGLRRRPNVSAQAREPPSGPGRWRSRGAAKRRLQRQTV